MKTVIGLVFLLLCPSLASAQNFSGLSGPYPMPKNGICAHRGANETHPENTLAAFKEAIQLGAHMIELDVQMTKDNELVIMHDATVNRTTNGKGRVSDLTLAQIKELDAGKWKSKKFKGEKVPTLKEALKIMPVNIWLNIHLKGDEELGAATAKAVIQADRIHQGVIACNEEAAKGVRKISPHIMICNMERTLSRDNYISTTIEKGFPFLQIKSSRDGLNLPQDLKRLKERGVRVNYFHAEEVGQVKTLLEAGVDFILTDHLQKMLEAYNNMGREKKETL
ncbi:glycerophosphodiester phosphodiesterase [Arenibacter aquaticus]|nr:glycerophosphodiester phosphodiesterase family protein [Arenibacter aquaticus]